MMPLPELGAQAPPASTAEHPYITEIWNDD